MSEAALETTDETKSAKKVEPKNETPSGIDERIEQWRRRAGRVNAEAVAQILENADSRAVLCTIFHNTQYLAECCLSHPDAVIEAMRGEPAQVLSEVARDLRALDRATGAASALARAIRPCKERGTVAIAVAEIAGKWSVERVGAALADLGERTLDAGLSWLTRMAVRHGDIVLRNDTSASPLPGLFVLGGGDFSAGEASYCGPLEVALVYDLNAMEHAGVTVTDRTLQRLAEQLKEAFRAGRESPAIFDLDLNRFDANNGEAAQLLALPVGKVHEALEKQGAVRMRAWFAHARVVAGDRAAGMVFLEKVGTKFWRAGLDAEGIKTAVVGGRQADAIDPVWRLAQTCRLALGPRLEDVRHASAHAIFDAAARVGALEPMTASRLAVQVDFWQAARNRMQLIDGRARRDKVTTETETAHALLCGYSRLDLFDKVLDGCVAEAEQQWLNIVEPPAIVSGKGPAAASHTTGVRLEELGFTHGPTVAATVDNWIVGRYGAGDVVTGRRRLSEVAPGLLTEFANTQQPDRAIALFDQLLGLVPERIDPFRFLNTYPSVAAAIVDMLGNATAFGETLVESPTLVGEIFGEGMRAPDGFDEWLERFSAPGSQGKLTPEFLGEIAHWVRENRARLVFYILARLIDLERSGQFAAAIAERGVSLIYDALITETGAEGEKFGRGLAVIALGDLGGRELVPGAPIDLAFVYDPTTEAGPNDQGHAYFSQFATRLAQAITGSALPNASAEGGAALFDIDTRKRPGGASSEIATDINIYLNFYQNESHPEEHVELTRARVICGPEGLKQRLEAAIGDCVTRPRKAERLMIAADKGRAKQQRRNRPTSVWDIERIRGGRSDLCFIAELLQVRFGSEHPYVLSPATGDALSALARAGCLDPDTATDLVETHVFFGRLRTMLLLLGATDLDRERPRKRLQALVARAAGVSGFGSVEPLIQGHADRVQAHYKRLILGDETASPNQSIVAA